MLVRLRHHSWLHVQITRRISIWTKNYFLSGSIVYLRCAVAGVRIGSDEFTKILNSGVNRTALAAGD
jgi:hypothetical protein